MTSPDVEPDPLVDALVQSAFTTMAVLSRVSAEHDLSLTQLRVLGILRDRRLRMAGLAGFLGLEKSTMSGLVDRAERRGLLERTPSVDDRRAVDVTLTAAGRELAESIHAEVGLALAPSLDGLVTADRSRLASLLERMLARV
jgi:DNA-binding MarR family transcriptional regulator